MDQHEPTERDPMQKREALLSRFGIEGAEGTRADRGDGRREEDFARQTEDAEHHRQSYHYAASTEANARRSDHECRPSPHEMQNCEQVARQVASDIAR